MDINPLFIKKIENFPNQFARDTSSERWEICVESSHATEGAKDLINVSPHP